MSKLLLGAAAVVIAATTITVSPLDLSMFKSLGDDNLTSYIESDIELDVLDVADEVMEDSDYDESAWNTALDVVNQQLQEQFDEILAEEQEEE